jgi:3-hydroxyacyl-CoA dehydrogenase/enoyl-CoA hydratase/3-hydroxybutyryl-CoA epimerase/3-hydroxyacyl-CoA dehydrogenase/enoyl-CoA hydratase/3-hydroxybutyryl-CoA epimerase/enoyl-CoA isomerase
VATAALIRGLVTMGGQQGELEEMSLEGQVHVVEEGRTAGGGPAVARAPGSPEAEAGLEIRGDQMQLTRPTRFDARAIVSGRPAEVRGRGLDLSGPLVDFDRGRNRLTVDGAGRLQVPLAAGAGGLESFSFTGSGPQAPAPAASAAAPGALDVTWQGRMDFDGLTARFVDQVVTSARGSVVRAGSLDVVFNRPVEFTAARQQPPGLRPVETILAGAALPAAEAGAAEGRAFAKLATSAVSRQLIRVFRLGERNRRDSGLDPGAAVATASVAARAGERPAVVGAGIMGAGIAASHLRAGFPLTLVDIQAEPLAASVAAILDEAAWDRGTRRADPARAMMLAGKLRTSTRMSALADCDLVIESVLERADIKRQVLAEIERTVDGAAVIATNTSTNPIAKLAEALREPARFCGIHFFNPVRRMTLVEVVRGPATSDATVATAVAHVKRLGKCPIVVRDSPGFLVNRVLMPYLHESVEMLRAGIEPQRIDRVARAFGMPMGPLELYDMIGLDTAFYAGLVLNDAYGDRIEASPLIPALVKSGRLGRKSGAGFYRYSGFGGPAGAGAGQRARIERPDEAVADLVRPYALPARPTTDATIADRLLLPMLLEALRTLDEGIVRDGRDIDLAVIHALGFPAFRGGLLAWGDSLGAAEVVRRLEPLEDLGVRMHPTPRLLALAASGEPFTA